MSHDHEHDHDHGHAHVHADDPSAERRLWATLTVSGLYMVVEAVGGWWTGSLALFADAGHMLSDTGALLLVLFALRIAQRPADAKRTYGYHRAEVLAAVANGATLIAIGIGVCWEAIERWQAPADVNGVGMLGIASGGLVVNLVAMLILAGGRNAGMNLRGAWLHVLSDALGSVGAMVAGVLVWKFGWRLADPIVSLVIAALIVRSAWGLLGEATAVLMEGVPAHLDAGEVRTAILGVNGVVGVHDLHIWTISSGRLAMSGHVVVEECRRGCDVVTEVAALLRTRFGIGHPTIQVEPPGFVEDELHP